MTKVLDLIEQGVDVFSRNERALVVTNPAADAELELSFYDYQQGRFIGEKGPSTEPHFFRAARFQSKEGFSGYLVGPEVTRFLRSGGLFGISSRTASLGDVRSKVRKFRIVSEGTNIVFDAPGKKEDPPPPLPLPPLLPLPPEEDLNKPSHVGGEATKPDGAERRPEELQGRKRMAILPLCVAALLLMVAGWATLARLGYYNPVVAVRGSLDFVQLPPRSASDSATFKPAFADIVIRRPWWVRPFEGWWISDRPPAAADIPSEWLRVGRERLISHTIMFSVRPKRTGLPTGRPILHSVLTFQNTNSRQVFERREATLHIIPPPRPRLVGQLSVIASQIEFRGFIGGPWAPQTASMKLAASVADLNLSIETPRWLANPGSLRVTKNSSIEVQLEPSANATTLGQGTYAELIKFHDTDAGTTTELPVRLGCQRPGSAM